MQITPEALGFGMWAETPPDEDSVDYVNRIRETTDKPLHEVVEELAQWQA